MEWRECEHEEIDITDLNHPETIQALTKYGLYTFFTIPGMKASLDFLEWMVIKWNVQEEFFVIEDHRITIDVDDNCLLVWSSTLWGGNFFVWT